jgi:hypothetical protein
MAWLNWSLVAMAVATHPPKTWGELAFTGDVIRLGLANLPLLFAAALLYLKGDWMEFCNTFAFSNWRTIASPCYGCWATMAVLYNDSDMGGEEATWEDFTMQDYLNACKLSETEVWGQKYGASS